MCMAARCCLRLHVRAASLSSYSQDIFSSRPTMSGVQGHCMSAPSLTGPGGVWSCLEVRPKRPATPRPKTCQVHGQGQTWPGHPRDLPLFSECICLARRCDRTLYKILVRNCNALAAALQQDTLQQLSSSQARSGCLYW